MVRYAETSIDPSLIPEERSKKVTKLASSLPPPPKKSPLPLPLRKVLDPADKFSPEQLQGWLNEFMFLGNCPPTPPLSQHFALVRSKC